MKAGFAICLSLVLSSCGREHESKSAPAPTPPSGAAKCMTQLIGGKDDAAPILDLIKAGAQSFNQCTRDRDVATDAMTKK